MFNEKSIVMGSNYSELSPKNGSESRTYKYTLKKGVQTGIGASSSGLGAMAHVTGVMHFTMIHLDENKKFQSLKTKYNFSAGTGGFFGWLIGSAHSDAHREEIQEAMSDVINQQKVSGTVNIDLMAQSPMINVQVDCSAYLQYMQVTDNQGNTYNAFSSSDAKGDTGAVSTNGAQQPEVSNNNSAYGPLPN